MPFWKEKHEHFICYLNHLFRRHGRGLGTGFAGLSAAAVISHAHHLPAHGPYMAVGIALSSDVLASAVSAYT